MHRGRFDIDMYEASFRLRGKTYDYKIQYEAVKKFMVLPKPDEMHCLLVIGLDPPLRQGQTRYPFVVMQFKKDEEVTIDLNIDEAELESKYKDKLEPHYEEPLHHVVAKIFRGLGNKKISSPAKDFLTYVTPRLDIPFDTNANFFMQQPPQPVRHQVLHQGQRRFPVLLRKGLHVRPQARHVHRLRADPVRHLLPRQRRSLRPVHLRHHRRYEERRRVIAIQQH